MEWGGLRERSGRSRGEGTWRLPSRASAEVPHRSEACRPPHSTQRFPLLSAQVWEPADSAASPNLRGGLCKVIGRNRRCSGGLAGWERAPGFGRCALACIAWGWVLRGRRRRAVWRGLVLPWGDGRGDEVVGAVLRMLGSVHVSVEVCLCLCRCLSL